MGRRHVQWLLFLVYLLLLLVTIVSSSSIENNASSLTADVARTTGPSLRSRNLQNTQNQKSTRRQFPECIQQKLSPEECQAFIKRVIESEGGHEVGDNIYVKIRTPRTSDVMKWSYWMIEVPVNIDGNVACQINNGKTFYPFQYEYTGIDFNGPKTYFDVESVDCLGLTAGECCLKILHYGRDLTEFGYDSLGNCPACFVHQVPLAPTVVSTKKGSSNSINTEGDNDETAYLSHELFPVSEQNDAFFHPSADGCSVVRYSSDQVDAYDATLITIYETAYNLLSEVVVEANVDDICNNENNKCDQMLMALWNAAVTIPPLSQQIGYLTCRLCYGKELDFIGEDVHILDGVIDTILSLLIQYKENLLNHSSRENCILIHTNMDGDEIVQIPELPTIIEEEEDNSMVDPNTPCNIDIRVCSDGQYCSSDYTYYDESNGRSLDYECRTYLQPGESCILWDFPEVPGTRVPQLCDPLLGFCKPNPRTCDLSIGWYPSNAFPIQGTCKTYGKPCTKNNGACDSISEFCNIEGPSNDVNNLIGQCETRLPKGTCCDPKSEENICEYFYPLSSDNDQAAPAVQLKCVPYFDYDFYKVGHACQIACMTDEECKKIDASSTTCRMTDFAYYNGYYEPANDEYGRCE